MAPSRNGGKKYIIDLSDSNIKSAKTGLSRKMSSDIPSTTVEEDWNHHYGILKESGMSEFTDFSNYDLANFGPNTKKRRKIKKRSNLSKNQIVKNLELNYGQNVEDFAKAGKRSPMTTKSKNLIFLPEEYSSRNPNSVNRTTSSLNFYENYEPDKNHEGTSLTPFSGSRLKLR